VLGQLDDAQGLGDRAIESCPPGWSAHALHLLGDIANHPDRFDAEQGRHITARCWPLPSREACALSPPTATLVLGN
jgi:hypothetical protein